MKTRRKNFAVGVLAAVIGISVLFGSGLGANASSGDYDATIDLSLQTSSGAWTTDLGDGSLTESLSRQGCRLEESGDTPTGTDLVNIEGFGSGTAFAGFKRGAIGTKDGDDGNGEPCARVEAPLESLELSLGSDVTGAGYLANGGQLALSFKFNATATIELFLDGVPARSPIELGVLGGSDCGPDSGLSDVGVIEIPVSNGSADLFDSLVITSTGSVSLVSASAPSDTHIHLIAPPVTVRGNVFSDRDTDGVQDVIDEGAIIEDIDPGLQGWIVAAYGPSGLAESATTDSSGNYEIADLSPGDYTICVEIPAIASVPDFEWSQVTLDDPGSPPNPVPASPYTPYTYSIEACSGLGTNLGDGGHQLPDLTSDAENIDFANVRAAAFDCDDVVNGETVEIIGSDTVPGSTLTIRCDKPDGLLVPFEVGITNDEGYAQFVTVGLDAQGTFVQEQTVVWAEEVAVYDTNNALTVATTKVILQLGGTPQDVIFCNTLSGGLPNSSEPHCIDSQTVNVGGDVSVGKIQVVETFKYLGDPLSFR